MPHPKNYRHKNEKYLKYIRTLACLVCGSQQSVAHHSEHSNGNDYLAIPLCISHHTHGGDSYHRLGHESFQDRHGLHLDWEIIELLSRYIEK